jgi:hypothetical protein
MSNSCCEKEHAYCFDADLRGPASDQQLSIATNRTLDQNVASFFSSFPQVKREFEISA